MFASSLGAGEGESGACVFEPEGADGDAPDEAVGVSAITLDGGTGLCAGAATISGIPMDGERLSLPGVDFFARRLAVFERDLSVSSDCSIPLSPIVASEASSLSTLSSRLRFFSTTASAGTSCNAGAGAVL